MTSELVSSLASTYALPLIGLGTATVLGAAARIWSTKTPDAPDAQLVEKISRIGSQALLPETTPSILPPVESIRAPVESSRGGHTGVDSRLTAQMGQSLLGTVITAETSQISAVIAAETGRLDEAERPQDGMLLVRVPQRDEEFDAEAIDKYLSSDKAQLVFSTAANQHQGVTRSIDLTKKLKDEGVEGEEISDDERQHKVNVQFAKIKHVLGLGGRDGLENKKISYSLTWHFVEVYNGQEEPPLKYDLVNKADIKRLLEDQDIENVDDDMVDSVFKKLRSINREIQKLTKQEVGNTKDCFLHDYEGNPSGLELFRPSSEEDQKVKSDAKHGMSYWSQRDFGFLNRGPGEVCLPLGRNSVNEKGTIALNKIGQAAQLKRQIYDKLQQKKDELTQERAKLTVDETNMNLLQVEELKKINGDLTDIDRVMKEVALSNDTVMNFTLMELTREHEFEGEFVAGESLLAPCDDDDDASKKNVIDSQRLKLSETIICDYLTLLARENKAWWHLYEPTPKDKHQAIEIGLLVHHLAAPNLQPTRRLEVLIANQRLNKKYDSNEVFRDPKGEKLILSTILGLQEGSNSDVDLAGYSGASDVVKDVLKEAIQSHQQTRLHRN